MNSACETAKQRIWQFEKQFHIYNTIQKKKITFIENKITFIYIYNLFFVVVIINISTNTNILSTSL